MVDFLNKKLIGKRFLRDTKVIDFLIKKLIGKQFLSLSPKWLTFLLESLLGDDF